MARTGARAGWPVALIRMVRLCRRIRPDVIHNHMYRAELVGTRAAIGLGEAGYRRPYIVSTVHSSRVRSEEDREMLRVLTPQMNQLIAVSRMIEAKLAARQGSSDEADDASRRNTR